MKQTGDLVAAVSLSQLERPLSPIDQVGEALIRRGQDSEATADVQAEVGMAVDAS